MGEIEDLFKKIHLCEHNLCLITKKWNKLPCPLSFGVSHGLSTLSTAKPTSNSIKVDMTLNGRCDWLEQRFS